jgi:glycosyltransferase involved in cell wall biosynthesis
LKRLSIIIPIYNVAPFVEKCLRSLEDQDLPSEEYEIICINDGSPDKSREVVIRIQREYDNIILIDQENQGVSRARNNGIDKACGRYLLFIDPDDYVDLQSFKRILVRAEESEAQVSFLGFTFLNERGEIGRQVLNENYKSQIFPGTEAYFLARGDGQTDPDRMWAVLFESKLLNRYSLRYLPDVPYLEDGELIARILCLADRCVFDGCSFYQRTTRPGSATNSKLFSSEKATYGFLLASGNLKKFQIAHELNSRQREFLNHPIAKFVLLAVNSSTGCRQFKKLVDTVQTLRTLSFRKIDIKGCNGTIRIYGKIYNISPYLSAVALTVYPKLKRLYSLLIKGIRVDRHKSSSTSGISL